MKHTRYSKKRVPRGQYYWFIDFSPVEIHMAARKCMETGNGFDNYNFARHNYYLTDEDAKYDMNDHITQQEFRRKYLRDLAAFRTLSPEKKREYRKQLRNQIKEEEN